MFAVVQVVCVVVARARHILLLIAGRTLVTTRIIVGVFWCVVIVRHGVVLTRVVVRRCVAVLRSTAVIGVALELLLDLARLLLRGDLALRALFLPRSLRLARRCALRLVPLRQVKPRVAHRRRSDHQKKKGTSTWKKIGCHSTTMPLSFYDEIELEDMEFDEAKQVFHYPCPCGDRFEITPAQLRDEEDIARCPSCTLIIRVIYDPVRLRCADPARSA